MLRGRLLGYASRSAGLDALSGLALEASVDTPARTGVSRVPAATSLRAPISLRR